MKRLLKFVSKILFVGVMVAVLAGIWLHQDYKTFTSEPVITSDAKFLIEKGRSLRMVAQDLTQSGYFEHPWYFVALAYQQNAVKKIQAGEYELQQGMTPEQILTLFINGKVAQYKFTIIEGWTVRQLLAEIKQVDVLKSTMDDVAHNQLMSELGFGDLHVEGQFLPETYWFPKGTSDRDLLRRAHLALNDVLSEAWQGRSKDTKLKSSYEALIMASIIEKETGVAFERPMISGVFNRRLRLGMRLQTDPTVIYGLGDEFDGDIRRRHLKEDTPYNTYTRFGLPPTPISLASEASIRAAVLPADGTELYFVAKGDGTHYFSETIEEHNKAVRKYQLKR